MVARACRASSSPRTSTSCSAPTGPASRTPGSPRGCFASPRRDGHPTNAPLSGRDRGKWRSAPDGTLLATGGPHAVDVWDIASDHMRVALRVATLEGALHFSPDGSTLAVGQDDGATTFWDIRTGEMIGEPLVGLRGAVKRLAFGADGSLVTASATGAAMWDLTRPALSRATKISPLPGQRRASCLGFQSRRTTHRDLRPQLSIFDPSTVKRRGAPIQTAAPGKLVPRGRGSPGWRSARTVTPSPAAGTAVPISTAISNSHPRATTVGRAATDLDRSPDGQLFAVGDAGGQSRSSTSRAGRSGAERSSMWRTAPSPSP